MSHETGIDHGEGTYFQGILTAETAAAMVIPPYLRAQDEYEGAGDYFRGAGDSTVHYYDWSRVTEAIDLRRSLVKECQHAAEIVLNTFLDRHTKLSPFYKQLVMLAVADYYDNDENCIDEGKDKVKHPRSGELVGLGIGPTFTAAEVVKRYLKLFEDVKVPVPHVVTRSARIGHHIHGTDVEYTKMMAFTTVSEFTDVKGEYRDLHQSSSSPKSRDWDPVWPDDDAMESAIRDRITEIDGQLTALRTPDDVSKYLDGVKTDLRGAGFVPGSLVWEFYHARGRQKGWQFPPVVTEFASNAAARFWAKRASRES